MIDKSEFLYDLIPHGCENAISTYKLSDVLGVGIYELKQRIYDLIRNGYLIAHSLTGYYIPTKEDHLNAWEFIQSIRSDEDLCKAYMKAYAEFFGK